jgi:hypothetical protein
MARLLGEYLGRESEVVTLARNLVFHERSKHIGLRYHFIINCLAEGSVSAIFISTADQLVDILPKALERVKFHDELGFKWSRSLHRDTRIRGRLIDNPLSQ